MIDARSKPCRLSLCFHEFPKVSPMSQAESQSASKKGREDWKTMRHRMNGMSLGIEMTAAVCLGYYIGYLVDGYFDSAPIGQIFFTLAGLGAAAKAVYRFYKEAQAVMNEPEPMEKMLLEMGLKKEGGQE